MYHVIPIQCELPRKAAVDLPGPALASISVISQPPPSRHMLASELDYRRLIPVIEEISVDLRSSFPSPKAEVSLSRNLEEVCSAPCGLPNHASGNP